MKISSVTVNQYSEPKGSFVILGDGINLVVELSKDEAAALISQCLSIFESRQAQLATDISNMKPELLPAPTEYAEYSNIDDLPF